MRWNDHYLLVSNQQHMQQVILAYKNKHSTELPWCDSQRGVRMSGQ